MLMFVLLLSLGKTYLDMDTSSFTITNVRLFDGHGLTEERTVTVDNGVIAKASDAQAAGEIVDGRGGTLLPGLIDSHVHILSEDDLIAGTQWGITTMLDMATMSLHALRDKGRPGVADIRSAGIPASAAGGTQTTKMGFPQSSIVSGPADAKRFVAARAAEGIDYIKVIVENPQIMGSAALDEPTIAALAEAAHAAGYKIIAHATTLAAIQLAADAGVSVITHAPLDAAAGAALVAQVSAHGIVSVPTLIMMQTVASKAAPLPTHRGTMPDYANARETVRAFHQAGIPIMAGTDANRAGGSPMKVPFGTSLHDELELLVEAGLTPTEALYAATAVPASYFGLKNRGSLLPGFRADLLLVDGDPTQDIPATRAIQGVWAAGIRVR